MARTGTAWKCGCRGPCVYAVVLAHSEFQEVGNRELVKGKKRPRAGMLGAFVLGSLLGSQEQSPGQIRLVLLVDEAVRLRRHGERSLGHGHLRRDVRAPRCKGLALGITAGLEGGEFGLLTRGCTGGPPRLQLLVPSFRVSRAVHPSMSAPCRGVSLCSHHPLLCACGSSLERPV